MPTTHIYVIITLILLAMSDSETPSAGVVPARITVKVQIHVELTVSFFSCIGKERVLWLAVLTALSGEVEVPGARVNFGFLVFQFDSVFSAHGGHDEQLPAVEPYSTVLERKSDVKIKISTIRRWESVAEKPHLNVILSGCDAFLCGFFRFKLSKCTAWASKREKCVLVTHRYHF